MPNRIRRNWLRLPTRAESLAQVDDFPDNHDRSPWCRDTRNVPDLPVDITEDDTAFCIRAEVPGLEANEIDVLVHGNQVVISAETKRGGVYEGGRAIISERSWGKCYRAFILPSHVDDAGTRTHCANGVLTLTLRKRANLGDTTLR